VGIELRHRIQQRLDLRQRPARGEAVGDLFEGGAHVAQQDGVGAGDADDEAGHGAGGLERRGGQAQAVELQHRLPVSQGALGEPGDPVQHLPAGSQVAPFQLGQVRLLQTERGGERHLGGELRTEPRRPDPLPLHPDGRQIAGSVFHHGSRSLVPAPRAGRC